MSETLREKLEKEMRSVREKACLPPTCFPPRGPEIPDAIGIIADHVDKMAKRVDAHWDYIRQHSKTDQDHEDRLDELADYMSGLESRIDEQDDHEANLKRDFDTGIGEMQTDARELREKMREEALELRGRCLQTQSKLNALKVDLATLAGADVPSSEGVDLEGEAMTADYNAMRDDANDDRPWREAAEACFKKQSFGNRSTEEYIDIIESAIEKAVGQAADSVFSLSARNRKLVKERDALKAEVAAKPKVVRLTREELESPFRGYEWAVSSGLVKRFASAILDLQERKAAEIEGGAK